MSDERSTESDAAFNPHNLDEWESIRFAQEWDKATRPGLNAFGRPQTPMPTSFFAFIVNVKQTAYEAGLKARKTRVTLPEASKP